mmetsp:Transcript_21330/g.55691  ORF Transcript_21330/g.55691 Transcript_21330/m.55691 type:complete len:99 (-) Transcript_21330:156-452(-)
MKLRGLRGGSDASSPGDVVRRDFFLCYFGVAGVHLVLDVAAVTGVNRNTVAVQAASQPGYAARQLERTKFLSRRQVRAPNAAPPPFRTVRYVGGRAFG